MNRPQSAVPCLKFRDCADEVTEALLRVRLGYFVRTGGCEGPGPGIDQLGRYGLLSQQLGPRTRNHPAPSAVTVIAFALPLRSPSASLVQGSEDLENP
jgi:hypothetical protein